MIPGKCHLGMTAPGTIPRSPMQPRARERKERRAKEGAAQLADAAQSST